MAKLKNTYQNDNAVVDITRTIAGLNLSQNITTENLINILNTGAVGFGDKIIEKSMLASGNSGYIKYNSGLIIQWGYINTKLTASYEQILPISFTTTNYVVCANTSGITAPTNLYAIACTPINNCKFYALATYTTQSNTARYIAIGY